MTTLRKRFKHPCFVSFKRFESSIEKVMVHTFNKAPKEIEKSLVPLYIGINVEFSLEEDKLKTFREFFKRLRVVNENHFVRFVVDTLWAMESDNGDVFYTCDEDKSKRCDMMWSIKVVNQDQIQITLEDAITPDRRTVLTSMDKKFKTILRLDGKSTDEEVVTDVPSVFCKTTKSVDQLLTFEEDTHILLIPNRDSSQYRGVLLCGLNKSAMRMRARVFMKELEYQRRFRIDLFSANWSLTDLVEILIADFNENMKLGLKKYNARRGYEIAEAIFSIYHEMSELNTTNQDVVTLHHEVSDDRFSLVTSMYSLEHLLSK